MEISLDGKLLPNNMVLESIKVPLTSLTLSDEDIYNKTKIYCTVNTPGATCFPLNMSFDDIPEPESKLSLISTLISR